MIKIALLISLFPFFLPILSAENLKSEHANRGRVEINSNYAQEGIPSLLIVEVDGHQVYSLLKDESKGHYQTHFSARFVNGIEVSTSGILPCGAPKSISLKINDQTIDQIIWDNESLVYAFICEEKLKQLIEIRAKKSMDDIAF